MSHNAVWTPENDALLLEMLAQGKTYSRISYVMCRTRAAIKNRARKLAEMDEEPPPPPPEVDPWAHLPANAFEDIKAGPDPAVQLSRPARHR